MESIDSVLTRGVEQILPNKNALTSLMEKRKITLYQGFDPTKPSLHIGNLIGIRKLAQFQKLGHKVIFLIGDFTAMIGDPTDKKATRRQLSKKQIEENLAGYKGQIEKVLKLEGSNPAEIKYNSEWLSKMNFKETLGLASNFTVQQMLERDFFQERLKNEKPIFLHEFLYPLMQGYDSVVLDVDLEIGGNDQLFNMMTGRTLMRSLKKKDKFVLTTKLLTDPQGTKMGKTEGNTINLTDNSSDMFSKVMSLPDTFIKLGFELLTDANLASIDKNPLLAKKQLAFEVVLQIHGEKNANEARDNFSQTFQKKAPRYDKVVEHAPTLVEIVSKVSRSASKAKRMIKEGAVDVDEATISDPKYQIKGGERIKIGKKTFIKVARP
ncbi:MAG: hypothetical protein UV74_C0013G0176 [Candidatus Woesebacteria bacterium GW2011_GWB1_43_14]|uniref:Tyrosine--tRNA ligase n=1 Tax=Candidatus Woesebacteria bacterium GW2011_GWB1_43_14 TaxID=1618578 RepID=A0A0G1DH70_9BACT|nr:MAG: tyrosyl-tRNA synthetase, tyrosyl-tRNA synthetase [Candidatus Woesebacteria bacterium GW2011_GWC1_42_9]KKS97054.1 MAG: hypothetical protein UV74_C0013G0176 [Candidatus Woesebacteria bacterium GW2011_GWB1_43_14]